MYVIVAGADRHLVVSAIQRLVLLHPRVCTVCGYKKDKDVNVSVNDDTSMWCFLLSPATCFGNNHFARRSYPF